MNGEPGSYYFWKWADNDLPGRPTEVLADLLSGRIPSALQPFNPDRLLRKLETAAADGRQRGEEWDWSVMVGGTEGDARSVFLTCPLIAASEQSLRRFSRNFSRLGLSGIEECSGHVIPCLNPKKNCFINGQSDDRFYDIAAEDLPCLIRSLDPHEPHAFGIIESPQPGHFVQCSAEGRRFIVEWAQNRHFVRKETEWDQWRAQDVRRLEALGGSDKGKKIPASKDPDLLTYAETVSIFEAFLRGEPRPQQFSWRNINHLIE